jgi:hypothetical protein
MAKTVRIRAMRVYVRPSSVAERRHRALNGQSITRTGALAPGFRPTPAHDLKYRGGRTIADLAYINFFLGGAGAWNRSDVDNINSALDKATSDPALNNVLRQYFSNQPISARFLSWHFIGTRKPAKVTQSDVERVVSGLQAGGFFSGVDLSKTVMNIMLPSGVVLTDGGSPESDELEDEGSRPPGTPEREEASSLSGLGGYHGSINLPAGPVYYAVGVYSQKLPGGGENGIAVFDASWKNVVATFYHELCEARTDPDVEEAIRRNDVRFIGWNSDQGEECGDFPVFEAESNLSLVFREVAVAAGGLVPIQLQYSNTAHGPEGPIESVHAIASALEVTVQDALIVELQKFTRRNLTADPPDDSETLEELGFDSDDLDRDIRAWINNNIRRPQGLTVLIKGSLTTDMAWSDFIKAATTETAN